MIDRMLLLYPQIQVKSVQFSLSPLFQLMPISSVSFTHCEALFIILLAVI
jgi:hypothetical protein